MELDILMVVIWNKIFDGRYVELDVLVIYIYIYGTRYVDGRYMELDLLMVDK